MDFVSAGSAASATSLTAWPYRCWTACELSRRSPRSRATCCSQSPTSKDASKLPDHTCGVADRQAAFSDVTGDHGASPHYGPSSDCDSGQDHCPGADPHTVTD